MAVRKISFLYEQKSEKHERGGIIQMEELSMLRANNWVFFLHKPQCAATFNSNVTRSKILKLFSIGIKELFQPLVNPFGPELIFWFNF